MRVLTIAHAFAPLIAGGGERAAMSLNHWLVEVPDIEPVLVARADTQHIGHSAQFAAFRGNAREIVADVPHADPFSLQSRNFVVLERMIDDLLDRFRPDVVHVQHFVYWSLDMLTLIARRGIPIVMTLHEYLLICHNDGQMIKTTGALCHAESPSECATCFPDRSAGEFFLRKAMILDRLAMVAQFVAPSHFLRKRFIAWGLSPERIRIIDNPLAPALVKAAFALSDDRMAHVGRPVRVGFFGQLNRYKGVLTLLEALARLPKDLRSQLHVSIHGAHLASQPEAFRARFDLLLDAVDDVVDVHAGYQNDDVVALMRDCDWIVVPSIWWENAPVVMEEAALAGRPVLCSAIGGMAEKIAAGMPGATFRAGDPTDLARALRMIVGGDLVVRQMDAVDAAAIQHERVDAYLALYREVVGSQTIDAPLLRTSADAQAQVAG